MEITGLPLLGSKQRNFGEETAADLETVSIAGKEGTPTVTKEMAGVDICSRPRWINQTAKEFSLP